MTTSTAQQDEVLVSDELDIVINDDETSGEVLTDLINHIDVHPELVHLHGPGGGWPTYRFHGTREALIALYRRYYNAAGVAYETDFNAAVTLLGERSPL